MQDILAIIPHGNTKSELVKFFSQYQRDFFPIFPVCIPLAKVDFSKITLKELKSQFTSTKITLENLQLVDIWDVKNVAALSVKIDNFDKIIVYYDNGQIELGTILNTVFSIHFANIEFRKAEPQRYRLLQAADFICSMELLKIKKNENRLSKSEKLFFYKPQELKKNFFRTVDKKRLTSKV